MKAPMSKLVKQWDLFVLLKLLKEAWEREFRNDSKATQPQHGTLPKPATLEQSTQLAVSSTVQTSSFHSGWSESPPPATSYSLLYCWWGPTFILPLGMWPFGYLLFVTWSSWASPPSWDKYFHLKGMLEFREHTLQQHGIHNNRKVEGGTTSQGRQTTSISWHRKGKKYFFCRVSL